MPVHPPEGGQFDVLDGLPWTAAGRPVNQFGPVVTVDRLGQSVVIAVPDSPYRRDRADLCEPLTVANGRKLRPGIERDSPVRQRHWA